MNLPPPSYIPRQSRTAHSETLNNEICIYEWTAKRVHALDATAAQVWALCDGTRSVAAIAKTLRREIGLHADEVVALAVAQFSAAGLLEARVPAGTLALSRRHMVKRLGVTAAMLPVVSSIAAPSALEAASGPPGNTQVFTYTGASQTFVVPPGVTQITVDALGASNARTTRILTSLGFGGRVIATLPVTAGETLTVTVGGAGSGSAFPGGFNGGGPSGLGSGKDGGGGGASDIRRGSTRILVAGGAGGYGGAILSFNEGPPSEGGDGGGLTGAPGVAPNNPFGGGGGGTQTDGGAGRAAGLSATAGTAGISGTGGAGGSGSGTLSFGGGGGGGYFGGGGGGGDSNTQPPLGTPFGAGAGGGGGSSYTDPAATNVTHVQGVRFGDGQMTISW